MSRQANRKKGDNNEPVGIVTQEDKGDSPDKDSPNEGKMKMKRLQSQ
jgi:hypothetical protein